MARHELTDGTIDPDFAALSPQHRADIWQREDAMQRIDAARNKLAACKEIAAQSVGLRGYSAPRLRSLYYAWVREGRSWRALMDRARQPDHRTRCARAMLDDIYRTYCERNQRANRPAWRQMLLDIRRGTVFTGIGDWRDIWRACYPGETPPAACPIGWVPPGMSYRNFQRYAKPTPFELAATRVGSKAARRYVPGVYSTRVGLLPGQVYQFDDVWHDMELVAPGESRKMVRPMEFAAVDVASTYKMAYLLRPQFVRPDGTRDSLKEVEFLYLVCHVLTQIGYHPEGSTWCVEHGTAALRKHVRTAIDRLTGGAITYRDADILGAAIHAGMWHGAGKGNFRTKALIEGSHRLMHYEMAMLPGQTGGVARGPDADRPEQLDGLEHYAEYVCKAWETLPEALRQNLWTGALSWSGYGRIYEAINRQIYSRHEHRIEGWEQNDWLQREWSVDGRGDWRPASDIANLPAKMQDLALEALRTPGLSRMRRWSPIEAWEAGAGALKRIPGWAIVDILGMDRAKRVRVQEDSLIAFEDRMLGPGRHRYAAWVQCPDGSSMALPPGREVALFVTPYNPREAVLVEASSGSVLGVAPQWASVGPTNAVAVSSMQELQGRVVAAMERPVIERHREEADDRLAGIAHNDRLISGAANPAALAKPARERALKPNPRRDLLADLVGDSAHTRNQNGVQNEDW